jgi:hypothetical protein
MYRLASSVPARDVTECRDRIRCTSEAVELVRGARYGVGKRRRAFGGCERGALTCGAGGRAFENRLIARRSSTAAVGAGTADVDDRVKGERFTACSVRPQIGRLPRGPARSLAPALAATRRPSASLRTDYRKMEQDRRWKSACSRGICTATAFGDVAARNRNETADSGRRGAKSAAAGRRKGGALHRQRHAPHLRFLLR